EDTFWRSVQCKSNVFHEEFNSVQSTRPKT
ncbi:unnamed protein product, partial [marine sediment metagenome]